MMQSLQPGLEASAPGTASLAMQQLLATAGTYPVRGEGGTANFLTAMVMSYGGLGSPFGAPAADGQAEQVANNQALYAILGPSYGGDGTRTYDYPNLSGRAVVGGQCGEFGAGSLAMTWLIAAGAGNEAPLVGTVIPFAGNYAPDGWLLADGSTYSGAQYPQLMEAIGQTFGGSGPVFQVPNLTGLTAVGAGQGVGLPPVALGQQVPGPVPGLGLNFVMSMQGEFPPFDGSGAFPSAAPFLGQVIAYAGQGVPPGWEACDGTLLQIAQNTALYSLLKNIWGGDGETDFALPDLRGRMIVGQ